MPANNVITLIRATEGMSLLQRDAFFSRLLGALAVVTPEPAWIEAIELCKDDSHTYCPDAVQRAQDLLKAAKSL